MRLHLVILAAGIAALSLVGEAAARGGGGSFSAARVVVAPRAAVSAGGRVAVARSVVTPRPATRTRTRLNSTAAIRAGGRRYITVTHAVTGDRCAHLQSRAGPPSSSHHYMWMARYNTCRGQ